MEILRKGTVYLSFRAIRQKQCRNCAFPQYFHTRKSGKITVFFAVHLWDINLSETNIKPKAHKLFMEGFLPANGPVFTCILWKWFYYCTTFYYFGENTFDRLKKTPSKIVYKNCVCYIKRINISSWFCCSIGLHQSYHWCQ